MMFSLISIFLVFLVNDVCIAEKNFQFTEDALVESYGKVIYCSALFRHGDRTVDNPYPTDPYQLDFWSEGKAQLTNIGKLHVFELGQWFRERYDSLVQNKTYRYDLLLTNSSDIDRTLMSAELFLAGFYPPSKKESWSLYNDLHWQPISIHTIPKYLDNVISMQKPCERFDLEVDILNNSPEFEALFEENREVFNYVGTHSGFHFTKDDVIHSFQRLWDVFDDLFIEESNNLTLPSWTKRVYPEPLKTIAQFFFRIPGYTETMQRLKGGPMLKHMIEDMIRKRDYRSWNRTFHFYSGHDNNVAVLLSTLGVFNGIAPPYCSLVTLELREKNYDHYVTVLFRNSSESPPFLLELPKCKNPCTLNEFIMATKSVIPEDWSYECDIDFFYRLYYLTPLNTIIFILIIMFLIGVLLIITGLHIVRQRQYKHYQTIQDNIINSRRTSEG